MSNKEITYRQCQLSSGNKSYVAWIPSKYSITNKFIRIDGSDLLWKVEIVYPGSISKEQADLNRTIDAEFKYVLGE